MKYKKGEWTIFCDVCGQECYASQATKLSMDTGKGGLIVCPHDVDKIDYGLIPYTIQAERPIPWTRINHTNTTDGSTIINYETSTALGV